MVLTPRMYTAFFIRAFYFVRVAFLQGERRADSLSLAWVRILQQRFFFPSDSCSGPEFLVRI